MTVAPTTSATPIAPAQRPGGVTLLGIFGILAGLFWGFFALVALVLGSILGAFLGGMVAGEAGAGAGAVIGSLLGFLFLGLAIVSFLSGIGLLARKKWGWYMGLGWAVLQVVQGVLSLTALEVFSGVFGLAVGALIAWYLLSPPVQAWFGVAHNTPWSYGSRAI